MTVADLRSVRACLDDASLTLLNACAQALEQAGVLEVLLEQAPLLLEGLQPVGVNGDDTCYRLGPFSECLLREYLAIASYDTFTAADKRRAMGYAAQLAGFQPRDPCDDDC